ncbi:NAD(P)-dependent oxidoreductase [Streptoalloteichus hindustanus]|uniref:Adenosylhomocysteinase n=1 Tax=Streptoalloteichus hindustanus TaxID=2017 RepID=A0A1M5AB89_STRHI|nr:NAD(P)-dependent oxidoreductase [Streptoalloteichus hindustanus]SHF27560.1 adenosylhomocysteinase [Streptoalloteichus hindustanus]
MSLDALVPPQRTPGWRSRGSQSPPRVDVLTGSHPPHEVERVVDDSAGEFGAEPARAWRDRPSPGTTTATFVLDVDGERVEVHVVPLHGGAPETVRAVVPPVSRWQVVIHVAGQPGGRAEAVARWLGAELRQRGASFTDAELKTLWSAMPLLAHYATPEPALADWALVFRDAYTENSVGFLLAAERAGLRREWIYALSTGDQTLRRDRVHAWFLRRGYRSDVLDDRVTGGGLVTPADSRQARATRASVEEFTRRAHAAGRRVLVIDHGGALSAGAGLGVGRPDAAVELTSAGLARVTAADPGFPVFDLAHSRLRAQLGHSEIADACLRRLRSLLPGEKFVGRRVLLVGYGALGSRLAERLRSTGCRVLVVDPDIGALVQAAERGFETARTVRAALDRSRPFLVVGCLGSPVLDPAELSLLPDGVLLAGFTPQDFAPLSDGRGELAATAVPGVGVRYTSAGGAGMLLLGDGRWLGLFEDEGIPNRGSDVFRAGLLIAARELCRQAADLPAGVHLRPVDEALDAAGLFDAYYDEYLA